MRRRASSRFSTNLPECGRGHRSPVLRTASRRAAKARPTGTSSSGENVSARISSYCSVASGSATVNSSTSGPPGRMTEAISTCGDGSS